MKKNLSNLDRIVRVVLAAVLAGLYFGHVVSGTVGIILLVLGGVFLLTSLIGFCPLYAMVGLSTCPKDK
jgi:TM2 domain-containing membrane protein YozV